MKALAPAKFFLALLPAAAAVRASREEAETGQTLSREGLEDRCKAANAVSFSWTDQLCKCGDGDGKRPMQCNVQSRSKAFKLGCPTMGAFSLDIFDASCTTCVCLPKVPDIDIRGMTVKVSNADVVTILKHGHDERLGFALDGAAVNYNAPDVELHQEAVIKAAAWGQTVVMVEKPYFAAKSYLCGVGLFTADELTCSALGLTGARAISEKVQASMASLAPSRETERGFGMEFELVGRTIPEKLLKEAKKEGRFKYALNRMRFNSVMALLRFLAEDDEEVREELSNIGSYDNVVNALGIYNLSALESCFVDATKYPKGIGQECTSHADCALTHFCVDCSRCNERKRSEKKMSAFVGKVFKQVGRCSSCPSETAQVCRQRRKCRPGDAVGGECPVALNEWSWTFDSSVKPLSSQEAQALAGAGQGRAEDQGSGFELVSPVLSGRNGQRSVLEIMHVLRRMGVQAGVSSGMHVHVNVASSQAPGRPLSNRQIASVVFAFAKYQLVIDELLQASRPGNPYARRFFLGECATSLDADDAQECSMKNPCHCARRFLWQLHEFVNHSPAESSAADLCNMALRLPGDDQPCMQRYPQQRYYALNMAPLARLGTLEFRGFGATTDAELAARWAEFAVSFVEHFGADDTETRQLLSGDPYAAMDRLRREQRNAKKEDLFKALKGSGALGGETADHLAGRRWEEGAAGCDLDMPVPPGEEGWKPMRESQEGQVVVESTFDVDAE